MKLRNNHVGRQAKPPTILRSAH
ncbi:hypothetical protein KGM_203423 [Danaus plexippus plexippus]|uniref:Uncharacterized protein n=1 Tax=Danaus plexippus plexippus TaxID=278856 RepID=A0A212FNT0_DANPL|nr:hypothetical protein KGM_203423 [Danaus plexippus plexippus]